MGQIFQCVCDESHDNNEVFTTEKKVRHRRSFRRSKTDEEELSKVYVQGKTLGVGGFGRVVQCTNIVSNTQVAMKIVNKERAFKSKTIATLMEQELEIIKEVDHPHIVKHYELLEDQVNFYIISELVSQGELYDYIMEVNRLTER